MDADRRLQTAADAAQTSKTRAPLLVQPSLPRTATHGLIPTPPAPLLSTLTPGSSTPLRPRSLAPTAAALGPIALAATLAPPSLHPRRPRIATPTRIARLGGGEDFHGDALRILDEPCTGDEAQQCMRHEEREMRHSSARDTSHDSACDMERNRRATAVHATGTRQRTRRDTAPATAPIAPTAPHPALVPG